MYSGSTLTRASGRFLGTHQKINRLAEKQLHNISSVPGFFPSINMILHFEGYNGPDTIKRKSPAQDEPWHFMQPFDENDTQLIELITRHYNSLVKSLRKQDKVKAAFEAAWLSHAIVDGLTPAHQYPYDEKMSELRNGEGLETRDSLKNRLVMQGDTIREQAHNNWKFWGPKGLFMTHAAFEIGIATIIKPISITRSLFKHDPIPVLDSKTLGIWYRQIAQKVDRFGFYDRFYREGWTKQLAQEVRRELIPVIIKTVTIAWYSAIEEAKQS